MKAFIAVCIAVGALWAMDVEMNGGRYSDVVKKVKSKGQRRDRGADGGLGQIERYRGPRDVLTFSNGDEYP